MQGQGCRWRVANKVDVGTTLKQTRLTLEERGCGGASLINTYGAAAPPQPRGLARPARSFKRLEGFAAAADAKRQREQPTGGRWHTQGSGWTGAACADLCEERAGASRCRDGPD